MTLPERVSSYLAIDIGATKAILRAVGGGRTLERVLHWSSEPGTPEMDLALLEKGISQVCAEAAIAPARTALAAAPTLDADGVVTGWPSRPHWKGLPLLDLIHGMSGSAVLWGDDATLAALAEARACHCPDLVYVGIGTGVGGGLVSGGHLLRGAWGGAAELGHLISSPGGTACRCGQRGCLQTELCADALASYASARRNHYTTAQELSAGAAAAEPWAEDVLDHAADVLAHALSVVSVIVQPARAHLGGGLGSALTGLAGRVSARLTTLTRPGAPVPEVHMAVHGHRSSLVGAELLAAHGENLIRGDVASP
jgi:kanosamine 6-kinase